MHLLVRANMNELVLFAPPETGCYDEMRITGSEVQSNDPGILERGALSMLTPYMMINAAQQTQFCSLIQAQRHCKNRRGTASRSHDEPKLYNCVLFTFLDDCFVNKSSTDHIIFVTPWYQRFSTPYITLSAPRCLLAHFQVNLDGSGISFHIG